MDNPWNLDTITDPASTKQPTNTTQLASPGRGQTAFEFWWRAATVTLTRIRKTSGCHTAVTGSVRWLRRDAPVSHPLPRTTSTNRMFAYTESSQVDYLPYLLRGLRYVRHRRLCLHFCPGRLPLPLCHLKRHRDVPKDACFSVSNNSIFQTSSFSKPLLMHSLNI